MMSSALAVANGHPTRIELPELEVGDLCIWTGKQSEHSTFKNRIIYRCVEKRLNQNSDGSSYISQRFVVAFDFENPMGQQLDPIGFGSCRDMKRLNLLDICTIRIHFDNFIREWAKLNGMGNPDDVR